MFDALSYRNYAQIVLSTEENIITSETGRMLVLDVDGKNVVFFHSSGDSYWISRFCASMFAAFGVTAHEGKEAPAAPAPVTRGISFALQENPSVPLESPRTP